MGLSENVGYIPNEIAIFHRDNDQQNHWVQWGLAYFQTHPGEAGEFGQSGALTTSSSAGQLLGIHARSENGARMQILS